MEETSEDIQLCNELEQHWRVPGYTVPSKGWTFCVRFNTDTVI
jgi:hypothetical protein